MLSEHTIQIKKSTVPVLEKHGLDITKRFYQLLFTGHPELLNILIMRIKAKEDSRPHSPMLFMRRPCICGFYQQVLIYGESRLLDFYRCIRYFIMSLK